MINAMTASTPNSGRPMGVVMEITLVAAEDDAALDVTMLEELVKALETAAVVAAVVETAVVVAAVLEITVVSITLFLPLLNYVIFICYLYFSISVIFFCEIPKMLYITCNFIILGFIVGNIQKLIIAAIGLSILFSVTVTPVYAWKNL